MKLAGMTIGLLLMLLLLSVGCGSNRPAETAATEPPPPPMAREAAPLNLRFMSYNVLWGGGLDRRFEQNYLGWQHPVFDGRNRFPEIMEVIRAAKPDVLAVQEAAGWDEGSPSVLERIGAELG